MKLSTKARYAVMAMVDLVSESDATPVSLARISERQSLPLPYLEQIFLKLKKNGLVRSARGSSGGYTLARQPSDITVYDVIASVDMMLKSRRCGNDSVAGCNPGQARCSTHDLWAKLDSVVEIFLKNLTLADVLDPSLRFRLPSSFLREDTHVC
jgi:Rrf2 family iron-sulfur cluster assembly transcriptional regulator